MLPVAQRLHGVLIRRPWLAPCALALLSVGVLVAGLGRPDRIIFDEVYYVEDALGQLATGVEPGFAVHPPLGKWLIAAGIAVLGDTPAGWRIAGALAGVVTVVLTHLLARRLLRGTPNAVWLALVAPVLLLTDGLFITQSRIAMLDAFLVTFVTAALLLLVADHQRRLNAAPRRWRPSLRTAAGVALGMALAVKWSGLLAVGVAGLLTIAWELHGARVGEGWRGLPRRAVAVVGSLLVIPGIVYALAWVPWLASYEHTHTAGCPTQEAAADACVYTLGQRLDGLARHHDAIKDFHLGLEATHTYRSDPLGWVVLERPVVYYWDTCSAEDATTAPVLDEETGELTDPCPVEVEHSAEVLAVGNPALWWGFLLLTPLLVAGTVTRDGRSAVALIGWLGLWLPWLSVSRTAFLFYLAPAVPLLAIGTTLAVDRLGRRLPAGRTYLGAVVTGSVAASAVQITRLAGVGLPLRLVALAGALGWLLGGVVGGVADRLAPPREPPRRPTTALWAATVLVLCLAVAAWFAPVWLGIPIDADAMRWRWWLDSWI